ncbi:MAG TPA: MFS transporter [Mycobacteriales bacterium]|nr:MFS transporter [Mycobacteriales bacterium]
MPRILLDVRPLRASADFRRLAVSTTISQLGGQMTTFAVALQVYTLTGSSAAVGGVGLAAAIPSISAGLLTGTLADAVDRRKLVLLTSTGLTAVSGLFAVQAFAGQRSVWLLYGLVALQYLLSAINSPARRTFTPRLLPRELIPAGAAITMLSMHLSLIAGPPLAGVITAAGGLRFCYLIDAVSFTAALYAVFRLPPMPPDGARAAVSLRAVGDGFRFIVRRKVVLGALLSDLSATALGMPIALFPAINADRFGGAPQTLGLLTAGLAAGGILGTALSGPVSHVARPGRAMVFCGVGWGLGLVGFGLAHSLTLTLTFLVLAGVADVLTVVFRSTVLQTATPDHLRGRTSSAEFVTGAAAPQLGNFRAGVLGSVLTPGASAVIGGVSCVAGAALLALTIPALRTYRTGDPELEVVPEPQPEPDQIL